MSLLTIMIPTINDRVEKLLTLTTELYNQIIGLSLIDFSWSLYYPNKDYINQFKIDILTEYQDASIGFRRNVLLQRAESKYVCFFDDDDMPTESYLSNLCIGMLADKDCCSLKGIYTINGQNPEIFEHSIKYNSWKTNEGVLYPNVKYERPPNHLNCIKSEIAKQFKFKDLSHGEDSDWSNMIHQSGLIKTEHYIDTPIYQYLKIV